MSHVSILVEDIFLLVKSVKSKRKKVEIKSIPNKRVFNVFIFYAYRRTVTVTKHLHFLEHSFLKDFSLNY